jgi:peptidylprolyl isomerase
MAKIGLVVCLISTLFLGQVAQAARDSVLPAGNAVTDGRALLMYGLPIDNQAVRRLQGSLEKLSDNARGRRWSSVTSDITEASLLVTSRREKILNGVPPEKQASAETIIDQIGSDIKALQTAAEAKDANALLATRDHSLQLVNQLENLMIDEFAFVPPPEYAYLPYLKGRATIAMQTSQGPLTVVVDGYNAPITAGNFVDLVQRGFYDGLEFIRSEESYVLQTGDPAGPKVGFHDPKTDKYRNVPLEIMVEGDKEPLYGVTLEEIGRFREHPVLPFSAYGTVAMARPEDELNGASSQFFFFLFEPELTPAGLNLLDGRYSVFGYLVEGKEVLEKLRQGDKIISAEVVDGLDNLVPPRA